MRFGSCISIAGVGRAVTGRLAELPRRTPPGRYWSSDSDRRPGIPAHANRMLASNDERELKSRRLLRDEWEHSAGQWRPVSWLPGWTRSKRAP
jgi:hypothetical protein